MGLFCLKHIFRRKTLKIHSLKPVGTLKSWVCFPPVASYQQRPVSHPGVRAHRRTNSEHRRLLYRAAAEASAAQFANPFVSVSVALQMWHSDRRTPPISDACAYFDVRSGRMDCVKGLPRGRQTWQSAPVEDDRGCGHHSLRSDMILISGVAAVDAGRCAPHPERYWRGENGCVLSSLSADICRSLAHTGHIGFCNLLLSWLGLFGGPSDVEELCLNASTEHCCFEPERRARTELLTCSIQTNT